MTTERRDVVFVVRMRLPDGAAGSTEWRGSVHEVASGARVFVSAPRDIADFIATFLAERSDRRC